MKRLLTLAFIVAAFSACKKHDIPVEIPPATTPVSCDNKYFIKLYDQLAADAIYATSRQELLLPFMNYNGTRSNQGFWFKKLDTTGKLLWEKRAGTFDGYYGTFFQKNAGIFYIDYLDFSNAKTFVSAQVDEDINFLKKTEVSFDGYFNIYKTSDRSTIAYARDVAKKVVFVDTNCDKLWEISDDKVQWEFGAEDDGYFYFAGSENLSERIENSYVKAKGYIIKLNRQGQVVWRQTYSKVEDTLLVNHVFRVRFDGDKIRATAYAQAPFNKSSNYGIAMEIDKQTGNLLSHSTNVPQDTTKVPANEITYKIADGVLKLSNQRPASLYRTMTLAKFNNAGAEVWKQQFGNTADILGLGVTSLTSGSIFILADSHYYDGKEPGSQSKKCLIKADVMGNTCHD
ncbi:hypothetical protein [Polluticoccus soli]|uniref:hypothetical protein n=1 Tax=Polluticoccus soli TaxID=3034150 RepID=UPI0023E1EBDA|nr:hypothetical protein [Flavipsychrobacter sp. JY13-12]